MTTKIMTLIGLCLILAGCNATPEPTVDDINTKDNANGTSQLVTYGVAGYITDISTVGDYGTILVEGELGKNGADYDKAYVSIDKDSVIYYNDNGSFSDFEIGQYVQVFFEGPVAESYPVQAYGRQVSIIEPPVFIDDPTETE